MASVIHFTCLIAFMVQGITCQYIGNPQNGAFNNGLQFGANFANGLAGPNIGGPGLGGSGLGGPGLGGPGCIGPGLGGAGFIGAGLGGSGLGYGLGGPNLPGAGRSNGGSFAVTSTSPIAPTGVSILAENLAIEGPLSVGGQLPFLGTVGIEGTLPATGSGTVSYGCGTGNIGITNDVGANVLAGQYGPGVGGQYGPAVGGQYGPGLAPGVAGLGFGAGVGYPSLSGPLGVGLNGPGLPGQGLIGNGLGGLGANLAGSGLGIGAGPVLK